MPVEGRDLSSRPTQDVGKDRRLGNLSTPNSVQKLQKALHAKAKAEPDFRFYALYDKLYREDILAHAYAQCRWVNWRLRSERRRIDRNRSDVYLSPRPMASAGRWVFQSFGIGSA